MIGIVGSGVGSGAVAGAVDGPGRVVAHVDMNADLRSVLAPLEGAARSQPTVPSDRAEEILAANFEPGQRDYVRGLMAAIATAPDPVLTDDRLLGMVADGYYDSPRFDPGAVARLRSAPDATSVNDDDVFELRVLTRDELAEVVPTWKP